MAADVQVKLETPDTCCASWKNKYSKLEEKRNALRQAVKLLEQQIDKIQAESNKVCEKERARADLEKEGKEKECAARLVLENEVAALKAEIVSLKQEGGKDIRDENGEVQLLRARVSELEKEINCLKQLVEKERKRADSERKNAEVEKKKAAEADKVVEGERSKAEKERNVAKLEKEKAEKYRTQIEALRKEADEVKSKLVSEMVRLEEANKKLEGERQKVVKEKKRAESEKAKADEQRKLVEANRKRIVDGKIHGENLSRQLEETKRKIDELQKETHELKSSSGQLDVNISTEDKALIRESHESKLVLELSSLLEEANKSFQLEKQKASMEKERADRERLNAEQQKKLAEVNWKTAVEEKSRADQSCKRLEEEKQKIHELEKQIHKLCSNKKSFESSAVSTAESRELKFLKEQVQFQKMKSKHAKREVKLERSRNCILEHELGRIKLDFDLFSSRLDMLHKSFSPMKGVDGLEKTGNNINMPRSGSESFQIYLQNHDEPLKPSFPAMDPSGIVQQTLPYSARLCPVPGANFVEPIAGIDSKLESLGGSTRKMLKSSAINSNTTSFSDGQLVGSQDKSAFSVTTSTKLVEEHAQPILSDLSEVTKIKSSENLAVVAENNVRNPVNNENVGGVPVHRRKRKRKRILETVETIENLYFEEKKLHLQLEEKLSVLHGMLNKQVDNPFRKGQSPPSFAGNSFAKHDRHNKKRKTSFQKKVVLQHACDSAERKKRDVVETEVRGNANFCKNGSLTGIDRMESFGAKVEGISGSVKSDFEAVAGFEELANGDYMNLLNLDNAADEECYRLAMEMPLSPILHEIEMQFSDALNVDNSIPLANETFCEGFSSKEKEMLPSHGVDTINLANGFSKSKSDGSATSTNSVMHNGENHVDALGMLRNDWHASKVEKASNCLSSDFLLEVEMTTPTILQDEKSKFRFGGELGFSSKNILERCILSNIEDGSSISRIQYAIRTCMGQCSLATQTGWMMREILLAVKMEEKLLAKEKVCALFSLLMINFSVTASGIFGDFLNWASTPCLDSYAGHVLSVMSDVEIRRLFAELGCLDELLNLLENFLTDGCVKVFKDLSFGIPVECDSRVLDDTNISLSLIPASAEHLVAGSIILASICAALDRMGFICETSYSILRAHRFSNSMILNILHIFAYLGGDRFFNSSGYGLLMTVLKSIVRNLEGLSTSGASVTCFSLVNDTQSAVCPCIMCPFSVDAMSVDTVTSLLLEKLKTNDILDTKCDTSGNQSDPVSTVTLSSLNDLLALMELVAYHMELLFSLVNLGVKEGHWIVRLGLEAFGFEDKGVEQLRCDLSTFFRCGINMKASLPIQIATVTASLGLLSVDFETIIQTKEKLPAIASESVLVDLIREWFLSLSMKQQELSFSILRTAVVNK
ncbi:hypothetical protein TorRG33x02_032280 [Trema orientale]|uniref:Maternal effect embryo arrest n=1 Tax=Trema orientale TaxID=63057 RepID=A0A2P5FTC1_TREOI|nr:hypothetical protein TorRG33x02_032280 [Trema orientale]